MGWLKWIILQEGKKIGGRRGKKEREAEQQSMVFPPELHRDLG